jgi:hypothetical protein
MLSPAAPIVIASKAVPSLKKTLRFNMAPLSFCYWQLPQDYPADKE